MINEVVQQALSNGYLTVEAEEKLRQLLQAKYGIDDLKAFFNLQQAVIEGRVKQQSRELRMANL
jgi:phage I-like protein